MAPGLSRALSVALAVLLADQATKLFVVVWLDLATRGALDVLPPVLNLRMAWNRGVNFGLLSTGAETMRWALSGLAVAISAGLLVWAARTRGRVAAHALGAVVGGALGNALDRVLYGAVADFLNMSCCGFDNPYSFNIADVAIFAGAAVLVLLPGRPAKAPAAAKSARDEGGGTD